MITFICYRVLRSYLSGDLRLRERRLMHVLGTAVVSLIEVSLCILTRVPLIMRCPAPMQRASLGRMFVLNVKSTRITCVPIVKLLGDVRMWGVNSSTCCANTKARGNLVSPWHKYCPLSATFRPRPRKESRPHQRPVKRPPA